MGKIFGISNLKVASSFPSLENVVVKSAKKTAGKSDLANLESALYQKHYVKRDTFNKSAAKNLSKRK